MQPITIALLGATGGTGRQFLQKALAAGHPVRALVRQPGKLGVTHAHLTVLPGDVLDPAAVGQCVADSDVVVSLFGHVKGSPAHLQTDGTRNLLAAMQQHDVPKIISLSGGGLPYREDQPKFADKLIRTIMKIAVPKILDDAVAHAEVLRQSDRQWIIVRGPRLTDEPEKGQYRVGWVGVNASSKVGRADLADFILKQVASDAFVGKMPFVSY